VRTLKHGRSAPAVILLAALAAPRLTLAADVFWAVDASGDWTETSKWSSSPSLPGLGDHAIIDRPAGDFLITHTIGGHVVGSLDINEPFLHSGGQLSFAGTLNLQKSFTLTNGASLTNATISAPAMASNLILQGIGELNRVALATNLAITTGNTLDMVNGLTLLGSTLTLNGPGGGHVRVYNSQTIGGTGTILMDASAGNGSSTFYNDTATTLTIGSGIRILTGNGLTQYVGQIQTTGLIQQGRITSQTIGCEFAITSPNWTNTGTLEAINGGIFTLLGNWSSPGTLSLGNGTLNLGGAFHLADLAHLQRTGGEVRIAGNFQLDNNTLALNPATGSFRLYGGKISNGTITQSGGAQFLASPASGVLDNITLTAPLQITTPDNIAFARTLTLANTTLDLYAASSYLNVGASSLTLAGAGTIILRAGNFQTASLVGPGILTIPSTITVQTGPSTSVFAAGALSTETVVNHGTLFTAYPGQALEVSNLTSDGIITGPGEILFNGTGNRVTGVYNITGNTRAGSPITFAGATASTARILGSPPGAFGQAVTVDPATTLTSDGVISTNLTLLGHHIIRPNGSNNGASLLLALQFGGTPASPSGRLDINDNLLVVQREFGHEAETLANLQAELAAGRNGGAWNGPGITSTTVAANATTSSPTLTLALADNADLQLSELRGLPLNPGSLLIVQATYGDANLDQKVDSFDLNLLAAHWQQPANALWSAGDFNNDGKVDSFDLNLLAANWQSGTSLEAALAQLPITNYQLQPPPSPIPEPASLYTLALAALPLLARPRLRPAPAP